MDFSFDSTQAAAPTNGFDPLPNGTLALVSFDIKVDDQGNAVGPEGRIPVFKKNPNSGAVYINATYTIVATLDGQFVGRKVFDMIGWRASDTKVAEDPGEAGFGKWGDMGRTFLRTLLEAARNIRPDDLENPARALGGFDELIGAVVPVRIGLDAKNTDQHGNPDPKNRISQVYTPENEKYAQLMALLNGGTATATAAPAATQAPVAATAPAGGVAAPATATAQPVAAPAAQAPVAQQAAPQGVAPQATAAQAAQPTGQPVAQAAPAANGQGWATS